MSLIPFSVRAGETGPLVAGNTAFALDLYARLKKAPGNVFFSPYSISTCLALAYAGARGNTEKQMAQVLHFPEDQEQFHRAFGELQRQLKQAESPKGIVLNIANALWAQEGHPFLPAFLELASRQYEANLKQVDFKTQADAATKAVNQWVAEQTRNKIQNLIPPGTLNSSTRLVLADAIYFKGAWSKPFDPNATRTQPFHLTDNREAQVPLMQHMDQVRYMENDTLQAVELPYAGRDLAMLIFLPRTNTGLGQLESGLTPDFISRAVRQFKIQEVQLFLPRFKLESTLSLAAELAQLGMPEAFGSGADFSGIDGKRDLLISAVCHKAWAEVTEEGTEAAAATGVTMALNAVQRPKPRPVFRADRPFLFLIRDTRSGAILFLGRLVEPVS